MVGFLLMIGIQGSGKTLMAVKHLIDNKDNRPIFSNCTLYGVEYLPITFNNKIEKNKGKIDILNQLDKDPDFFNGSIMLIDEIHLYLDSLDFMKKNSRRLHTFFSQLRKRKILLLGTTQYLLNLDVRIRRQCLYVFEMDHRLSDLPPKIMTLLRAMLESGHNIKNIFHVNVHEIDGYFSRRINEYFLDLSEYYDKYDTDEVIL